jgi:hypothetical protein
LSLSAGASVGVVNTRWKENIMRTTPRTPRAFRRVLVTLALALGVGFGSYGLANAATGSSSTTTTAAAAPAAPPGGTGAQPWGHQRSDETLLTGDALAKVKAIALDKVPGGSIVRVETDADGNAAYEAHVVKADGTQATVYVDAGFNFVSIQTR